MSRTKIALRAVLGLVVAFVLVIPAINLAGGWITDRLGIDDDTPRLAVDLCWIFIAGMVGSWACLRIASGGFGALAAVFLLIAGVLDGWAVIDFWQDWPTWFSLGVMLSLPLQVALGWRMSRTHRRRTAGTH